MRIVFSILIILCVYQHTTGQTEVPENGFVQFFNADGQVLSEGWMRDGKPDGYWTTYWTTGIKKSEGRRTNFLLDSMI